MPDLKPTTALGDPKARVFHHGALTLQENDNLALASLALRRSARQPEPFGLTLPGPGEWVGNGTVSALWTGQDQWLIEGSGKAGTDFAAEVAAQSPGCSVTEQTDGFVTFEIRSGAGESAILAVMAKIVNLDPARLAPGSSTRTGLEHMSAFIIRRATDHLAVIGMRSAAESLWHALEAAVSRVKA